MAEKIRLGSARGVLLELRPIEDHDMPSLIWGRGGLTVNGNSVVSTERNQPLEWTWLDLLEWLAESWPYLFLEQSYPFQINTISPVTLQRDMETRWESMSAQRVEDEEDDVFAFLRRHDIAEAFKGTYLPSCYLMRVGQTLETSGLHNSEIISVPLNEAYADLEQIGEGLVRLAVADDQHPRAVSAVQRWQQREQRVQDYAIPLLTGVQQDGTNALSEISSVAWGFDPNQPLHETELMAAARMTKGGLAVAQQSELLAIVGALPLRATPALDCLSRKLKHEFKEVGKPHDQGYWAARWLRREMKYRVDEPVNTETLLSHWSVHIQRCQLDVTGFDALACWGKKHGPAVILNVGEGNSPAHEYGANSTLAHEICHLLLDRGTTLPVAEVVDGGSPERLEKRARAFAAEFLLPRIVVERAVRHEHAIDTVIQQLSERYKVSEVLVSWQAINSNAFSQLTDEEQSVFERRVR